MAATTDRYRSIAFAKSAWLKPAALRLSTINWTSRKCLGDRRVFCIRCRPLTKPALGSSCTSIPIWNRSERSGHGRPIWPALGSGRRSRRSRRQREHHVEVGNRQKLVLPRGEPLPAGLSLALGAMPVAAGIVGHADRPAGQAALDMAAQFGGPAQLDGAHRSARRVRDDRHEPADTPRHGGGRYPPPPVSPTWAEPISPAARLRCSAGRAGLSCAG